MKQTNISTGVSSGGGGGGGGISNIVSYLDYFDASDTQTIFNLTFTYTIGSNQLFVTSGGIEMLCGRDYTETSTSSITFLEGREANEVVIIRKLVGE